MSVIEERLMHGTGKGDAWTVTDSPGLRTCETRPSMETPAGERERSPICIDLLSLVSFDHGKVQDRVQKKKVSRDAPNEEGRKKGQKRKKIKANKRRERMDAESETTHS
jgi:hypothetical protein